MLVLTFFSFMISNIHLRDFWNIPYTILEEKEDMWKYYTLILNMKFVFLSL